MKTYLVTLADVPGIIRVEADRFRVRDDLVFYRKEAPVHVTGLDGEEDDIVPEYEVMSYAKGVWRTVMEDGLAVSYQPSPPPAQGRASRENSKGRQAAGAL